MDIEVCLSEYKALTLDIMERTNTDGLIEYLINERQQLLNEILKLEYLEDEIKKIADSLNIIQLEKELEILIKKEKVNTKKKIENLKKMRVANIKYMSMPYMPSMFSKEI